MYKQLFLFLIALTFSGIASAQQIDRRAQVALNGSWKITEISFPDSENNPIKSFGIADSNCFEGSIWKFNSSDDSGGVALTKSECLIWDSPLQWTVNKEQQLLLKIVNANQINKTEKIDFILKLTNQTRDSFQLIEKVELNGKTTNVIYSFRKQE